MNILNKQPTAVYIRVSTLDQAEHGVSLDAQQERLIGYAVSNGLDIVKIFREEAISGTIPLAERPEGSKLVRMVNAGQVSHVVALKLDRLFRSASDALSTTAGWDKQGIALHLVDMGGQSLNTSSSMGRMVITMMAGFAEFERNLISERTASALAHKKANSQAYSPTPYGKDRDGNSLTDNPQEQVIISKIRTLRDEGLPLRGIANHLNGNGIPTKNGRKWHASTGKYLLDRIS